jgi:exopolysaccharide production protein ExoY
MFRSFGMVTDNGATSAEVLPSSDGPAQPRAAGASWAFDYLFNAAIASVALLFFAPLMLLTALAIWAQDGQSVFFGHRRIGKDGKMFACLKFRSMAVDAEARLLRVLETDPAARAEWEKDFKLQNDPRITTLGHFLRKSSLDELPQLFNVLRGEMNIVGPRPIVDAETIRYGRWFPRYCQVKPGITGLWQVSGRNDVDYKRRVALDVCYVRRRTFMTDIRILLMTVPAVLLRKGAR